MMRRHGVKRGRVLGVLALVPLLSGCWLQIGHGPEHRRYNPDETALTRANVGTLAEAWSTTADDAFSEPIVSGNRVYASWAPSTSFSAAEAHVRAVDAGSGATIWETRYFGFGGRFGTSDVPVVLVDDQLWTGVEATMFLSPPFCISADARLATDGSIVGYEEDTPTHSPAIETGGAVVRTRKPCSGSGAALEVRDAATAAVRWTATLPNVAHLVGLPTVVDDRIVVPWGTQLLGFPLAGCGAAVCTPEWSVDVGSPVAGNVVVGGFDGEVLMVTATGTAPELVAVDAATGAERWRAPAGTAAGDLAVTEDAVFVGGGDTLRAFDGEGRPLWTGSLGGESRGAPVTAGGVVYQGTGSTVRAFDAAGCDAATCDALASVTVTGNVSELSVAGGRLFVSSSVTIGGFPGGDTTGYLTAFAPG